MIYTREVVVGAENEADAIARARKMTDIGPYTGENFRVVPLCPVCRGERKVYQEDLDSFFKRFKALRGEEQAAAWYRRQAEARPCPECQN